MVLGPLGVVLGPLEALLRPLGMVLGRSWGALVRHDGPLEGQMAKMLIFHWFYKGLAAQLPRHVRQQHRGPEPWRGVGGRHKSLPPRV